MPVKKQIKTLQLVSIIFQIIFRELVGSLLKSLNLKVFICCRITTNYLHNFKLLIKTFKFSDFNKEPTSYLKITWMMIETCWSVFKCFNTDILD
jgi:hypothetical protein